MISLQKCVVSPSSARYHVQMYRCTLCCFCCKKAPLCIKWDIGRSLDLQQQGHSNLMMQGMSPTMAPSSRCPGRDCPNLRRPDWTPQAGEWITGATKSASAASSPPALKLVGDQKAARHLALGTRYPVAWGTGVSPLLTTTDWQQFGKLAKLV